MPQTTRRGFLERLGLHRVTRRERATLVTEMGGADLRGVRSAYHESIASGLTPHRLGEIWRDADRGQGREFLTLAAEAEERDAHYQSVLQTRKLAVLGLVRTLRPASEAARDVRVAEAIETEVLEDTGFEALILDLLDGVAKGYSIAEIVWDTSRGSIWLPTFKHRDPRFFTVDERTLTQLRLITEAEMVDGEELVAGKWVIHTPRLRTGPVLRRGLARTVLVYHMLKSFTMMDWAAFSEAYGMPIRIGRYMNTATEDEIDHLKGLLRAIGSDAAAALPEGMNIEFIDAVRGTKGDIFEGRAEWLNKEISKLVLGQTMTVEDGSSMAQAQVHDKVRWDLTKADARQLAATIQRDIIGPFVALNFGENAPSPHFGFDLSEEEDMVAFSQATTAFIAHGLRVRADEVRERLGLSAPGDGDEVLGGRPEPEEEPTPDDPAEDEDQGELDGDSGEASDNATNSRQLHRESPPDADIEELIAELEDAWEPIMDPLASDLEALAADSADYEEFEARLADVVRGSRTTELVRRMATAAFKARGLGDARD